jgi:uncharacterized protein (DUF2235 family)
MTSQSQNPLQTTNETTERLPKSIRALKDSKKVQLHPRTLIICLDGTGDRFDNDNSNVVHFVSCLKKHEPEKQVTYYQSGIGTYDQGGLQNGIGAAMDMAVGSGLGTHIKDAYKFLMQNYHDGDKICLFGFSRGAYTIRCLAGMLRKVGLLPAFNGSQIEFAYDFYKDDSEEGWKMSEQFKQTFCTHVDVYFVGLWDCVSSVGFIPRTLPSSQSPTNSIHHYRHAMALDERRAKFKVLQWEQENLDLKRCKTIDRTPSEILKPSFWHGATVDHLFDFIFKLLLKLIAVVFGLTAQVLKEHTKTAEINGQQVNGVDQENMEDKFKAQDAANKRKECYETDALEVWFMGAHADVGGGAVPNESRHMLSRIPLRWMIRQCFDCDTGILFKTKVLAEQGLDVMDMWPVYKQPKIPSGMPQPALMKKYLKGTLAPLQMRSMFLPIGPEDNKIKDAPTADDLSYILPSEASEDYFDAMAKPNDQLIVAKTWWMLEFWPVELRVLAKTREHWEKMVSLNMGRYRAVRETKPNLHWTVEHMIQEGKYKLDVRADKYVDWNKVA